MNEDQGVHVRWYRNGKQIQWRGTFYEADITFDWEPDEETVLKHVASRIHEFYGREDNNRPYLKEFRRYPNTNSWHVLIHSPYLG